MTILKQVLCPERNAYGKHTVILPRDAAILSFGLQESRIVFWYTTNAIEATTEEHIYVGWTGQPLEVTSADFKPVCTLMGEFLVHHIFIAREGHVW